MLLDCAQLRWNVDEIVAALDSGVLDYGGLMYEMRVAKRIGRGIPPQWNSLEKYEPDRTCLLHYTDMHTQPWVATSNPLGHLWVACLRRAIDSQFITQAELTREIAAGHVRPSLEAQVNAGIDDALALPRSSRRRDRGFVPPYRYLHSAKARPWTSFRAAMLAAIRRRYLRSPLPRLFS
jgi:hypothetical protein